MMFEFMTSDMRKPMPESIDDLLDMDYILVTHANIKFFLSEQLNGRDR
jgi:hypothetical protein